MRSSSVGLTATRKRLAGVASRASTRPLRSSRQKSSNAARVDLEHAVVVAAPGPAERGRWCRREVAQVAGEQVQALVDLEAGEEERPGLDRADRGGDGVW